MPTPMREGLIAGMAVCGIYSGCGNWRATRGAWDWFPQKTPLCKCNVLRRLSCFSFATCYNKGGQKSKSQRKRIPYLRGWHLESSEIDLWLRTHLGWLLFRAKGQFLCCSLGLRRLLLLQAIMGNEMASSWDHFESFFSAPLVTSLLCGFLALFHLLVENYIWMYEKKKKAAALYFCQNFLRTRDSISFSSVPFGHE